QRSPLLRAVDVCSVSRHRSLLGRRAQRTDGSVQITTADTILRAHRPACVRRRQTGTVIVGPPHAVLALCVASSLAAAACANGDSTTHRSGSTRTTAPATSSTAPAVGGAEITNRWSGTVDPTALPIGDGKRSTTAAAVGTVYACQAAGGGGGASANGPWIHGS